jgi:DNA transformation protein and related proteins
MNEEPEFIRYLRDQFRRWGPVEVRRMFGGHGIFRNGTMFALINDETLYLRSDDATKAAFAAAGMGPFRYRRQGKLIALGYHQAPPEAVEDGDLLAEWAERAYGAALQRAKPAARKPAAAQPRKASKSRKT